MRIKDLFGLGIIGLTITLCVTIRGCQSKVVPVGCHDMVQLTTPGHMVQCDPGAEEKVSSWTGGPEATITVECHCH
jgi:hypothetical protein